MIIIHKTKIIPIVIFLILFPAACTMAAAETVSIDESVSELQLGNRIDILEDKTQSLTINDITSGRHREQWTASTEEYPRFGFSSSAVWVRVTIRNSGAGAIDFFVEQRYQFIDNIDLYYYDKKSGPVHIATGDSKPFSTRPYSHSTFIFPLRLAANGETTYYLRYQSSSPLNIYLSAAPADSIQDRKTVHNAFIMFYAGSMVLTALAAIFISIFSGLSTYILYFLFFMSYSAFIATQNGMAAQFIWPGNPQAAGWVIPALISMTILFVTFSIINFLNLKDFYPEIKKRSIIAALISIIILIPTPLMPAHTAVIFQCAIAILFLIYVLSVCIQLFLEKYRPSYFLLIACSFFFLGVICHILMLSGAIAPGIIADISLPLSIIVMIALFPIALIDSYTSMRNELENLNRELEEKIYDRTRELFLSEVGINAYIKVFNEFSGVKQDFVDANSIQNYLDNVGATSLDLLTMDIGIIADLDELLNKVLTNVLSIMHAQKGYIYLLSDKNVLEFKTPKDLSESQIGDYVRGIVETTISQNNYILKTLTREIRNMGDSVDSPAEVETDIRYILSVPIRSRDSVIGVCFLENSLSDIFFTETTAKLLVEFLSQTSIVIDKIYYNKKTKDAGRNLKLSSITEQKLERVMAYIQENYKSDLSREGLASLVNIHPDSLSRFFKVYTSKKINEFINELRIKEAALKLMMEDCSVIDIAYAVGFESLTTFNRAFSKVMKTTPTEFKEKSRK